MNFAEREGSIWLDGEWLPWQDAKVHVLTHTLHYGLGAFEGIRAYKTQSGTQIFRLEAHLCRLSNSARLTHLTVPYDQKTLIAACIEVLRKNKLQEGGYIRPLLFLGSEGMGLHAENVKTHLCISAWKWGAYLGEEGMKKGVRIKTSTYRRNHIDSLHVHGKICGHYVNSMLALREAQLCGYDEALMLDHLGFIAEGSGENFFIVKKGAVYTPCKGTVLEGITRDTVIQLCADLGIPCREMNITRDEAYLADEAFFTGTAAEITPIREIDGRMIGEGVRGSMTEKLQNAFFEVVQGENPKYAHWLTMSDV